MSKKERMPSDAELPESQRERVTTNLSDESAEREEIARKRRALEYLIEMRKEADRIAAPILNATECYLDECEAEDALRSGALFSDPNDDLVN